MTELKIGILKLSCVRNLRKQCFFSCENVTSALNKQTKKKTVQYNLNDVFFFKQMINHHICGIVGICEYTGELKVQIIHTPGRESNLMFNSALRFDDYSY